MERAMTMPRYGAGVIHDSSSRFMQQPAPSCNGNATSGTVKTTEDSNSMPVEYRKGVRYRECLKNHAASMGGQAVDGCGEFMPGGEDGSLDGLKCAACGCHRNFHRREAHGEPPCSYCLRPIGIGTTSSHQRLPLALPVPPLPLSPPTTGGSPSIIRPTAVVGGDNNTTHMSDRYSMPSAVFAAYSNADIQHQQHHHLGSLHFPSSSSSMAQVMKKRFRTKFSNDQKEKMRAFAEKLGWRIQKQDEAAVQQFCMETGIKRHVLKVWMHNNKSNGLSKNLFPVSETFHESVPESA